MMWMGVWGMGWRVVEAEVGLNCVSSASHPNLTEPIANVALNPPELAR